MPIPDDVHSPRHRGFFYSHVGWIFARRHDRADLSVVPDLACYPELRWLHAHENAPAVALAGDLPGDRRVAGAGRRFGV
ncbi:MAG TPA: hypothetical protein VFQ57_05300 [Sphingomonas sp.]|nr:hypothetical protein [Sphingomonas sp.]